MAHGAGKRVFEISWPWSFRVALPLTVGARVRYAALSSCHGLRRVGHIARCIELRGARGTAVSCTAPLPLPQPEPSAGLKAIAYTPGSSEGVGRSPQWAWTAAVT